MEELLQRIGALSSAAKWAILAVLMALLGAGYYYFYYSDLLVEKAALERQGDTLKKERADYEKRKNEYLAYRNEVNKLLDDQKELLRVLPKKDDIEQFIESVNAQIELSGLSKVSSVREPAVTEEMYVRIPIRMSLVGGYHQINRFFKNIGELKRIVTITDLALKPADVKESPGGLRADFMAMTFQQKEGPSTPAAGSGTRPVTSGGTR